MTKARISSRTAVEDFIAHMWKSDESFIAGLTVSMSCVEPVAQRSADAAAVCCVVPKYLKSFAV